MSEIQGYVTLIKDIITGVAAVIAAYVALAGLKAWKKQLKGKTEYELAQRLLRATYKVRDALSWVRNPFISLSEITVAMTEQNIEGNPISDSNVVARSEGAVYERRWQKVTDSLVELDSVSLEAETIWGQEVKNALMPLKACIAELSVNIQIHVQNINSPYASPEAISKNREIISASPEAVLNPFSEEIKAAVSQAEETIKPHLKL